MLIIYLKKDIEKINELLILVFTVMKKELLFLSKNLKHLRLKILNLALHSRTSCKQINKEGGLNKHV